MAPENVNYQPLEAINTAWKTVMRTGLGGWAWPLAAAATAAGIWVSYAARDIRAIMITVFYFAYISALVNRYKNKIWSLFAAANGWQLDAVSSVEANMPPSLKFGHSPKFSPIIKANLNGTDTDLFEYECTTGHGRSSQSHYFTVAATRLPKIVPHILLYTKKGHSEMRGDIDNAENFKLEGDFNDYFRLQIEKGQEIDALTIITPDVMQAIVGYGQGEDIEMTGDQLYFIIKGDKRDPATVKQLIRSVVELSDQLKENIRLSSVQASAPAAPAAGAAASPAPGVTPSIP